MPQACSPNMYRQYLQMEDAGDELMHILDKYRIERQLFGPLPQLHSPSLSTEELADGIIHVGVAALSFVP